MKISARGIKKLEVIKDYNLFLVSQPQAQLSSCLKKTTDLKIIERLAYPLASFNHNNASSRSEE